MDKKERAACALMAVFPTSKSFLEFNAQSENQKTLASFTAFAAQTQLIPSDDAAALADFIREKAGPANVRKLFEHLTFEDLLEQKELHLELKLSVRALADRINGLLAEYRIDLPKLSNSILTRLKKEGADTLHKQNVLRALAFWLGHERPHLAGQWNYESLRALCGEGKQSAIDHKEGVRVGFALYSRGDVIDHDIVGWLKKELKNYIETSLDLSSHGRWARVRSHDVTTLYVDFPKTQELDHPDAYRQSLRNAISLAHQMAIRWVLSEYHSSHRFLSIGVAVGDFAHLDNHLIPVFNAALPGDPVIRMTDYARQCMLLNDIRVIFCDQPMEITLINGEKQPVWWVEGLWNVLYFDFVPKLLQDPVLGTDNRALGRLMRILWPTVVPGASAKHKNDRDAVSTLLRNPQNALLSLEIAKTLYYRRRFREALEILKHLLRLHPKHLNARTLHLSILRSLALDAPSYGIARRLFRQALCEAEFIQEQCESPSEDFYCEYALVYLAKAMVTTRYLRSAQGAVGGAESDALIRNVMAWLERCDALFYIGMVIAPAGLRAMYLLGTVRMLSAILDNDLGLFVQTDRPLGAPAELISAVCADYVWETMGFLNEEVPKAMSLPVLEKIYEYVIASHDNSISLQAFRPATHFCGAVVWWDMFPVRTVGTAKRALRLLRDAVDIAKEVEKKDVCIYSLTRSYIEMMPVRLFLSHVENGIRMIETQVGGNIHKRLDEEILAPEEGPSKRLLLTLNF